MIHNCNKEGRRVGCGQWAWSLLLERKSNGLQKKIENGYGGINKKGEQFVRK